MADSDGGFFWVIRDETVMIMHAHCEDYIILLIKFD